VKFSIIAEETLEPGPEGKLISTEERIQNIQQQKTSQTSLNESKPEPEGMSP